MNEKITGSCLCGGVHFSATLPFLAFHYCHCGSCQKASGTAHTAMMIFPLNQFAWISGEDRIERFTDSTNNVGYKRWFCRQCGAAVPRLSRTEQAMVFPAGLIDGAFALKPLRSIYWDERVDWLINLDAIPKFAEGPTAEPRQLPRADCEGTYPKS